MDTNDLNLPQLQASSTPRLLRNRELLHSDETDRIIAAGIEVHRALGPGFLEQIYEEALALELHRRVGREGSAMNGESRKAGVMEDFIGFPT